MQEIQRYIRYALSIGLTLIFILHASDQVVIPALTNLENQAYDGRLKMTLPDIGEKHVVIIDIDEKSLGEIGHWPWNRDVLAKIIDNLFDHYNILELGFDIVFAEADIDEGGRLLEEMANGPLNNNPAFLNEYKRVMASLQRDQQFADSLKNRKTIMGLVFDTDTVKGQLPNPIGKLDENMKGRLPLMTPKGYTANIDILQNSAYGGGFFDNPLLDNDGVFRRVPLLQVYDGQIYESLALALTRAALNTTEITLDIQTSDETKKELFLEGVLIGNTYIPVDDHAGVLVPYIGKQRSFDYIPASDVLNKKIKPERLRNKIAIFGTSAPGLLDLRTTPLEAAYPGVEVHANIIQGILDQRILHQPTYTRAFEVILLLIIGLTLTFTLPVLSALWGTIASISTVILLLVTNLVAWTGYQFVLPIAASILMTIMLFTLQMIYGFFIESRGKRQLAHLFGQYVPPALVDEMSKKMEEINLDGELKNMSVLFSDVRGFTTISEGMEPKELTQFINGFLTPITEIIHDQRGTIDKYMGDAVMAFWGAPLDDDQHALHALTAAMKMIERMKQLQEDFAAKGWPDIKIGVGVNTGDMNVGNKGSEFRVDYTVLGDAVNLGSRLESLTKQYGVDIIVGETTKHAVPEFEYRELDRVKVKGKDKPVTIYEPLGPIETVDKSVRKDIKRFNQALHHYRSRNWDEAEREIFALSSVDKERKIYQIYLDRIMLYRENPPPDNWDGSFTHTSK